MPNRLTLAFLLVAASPFALGADQKTPPKTEPLAEAATQPAIEFLEYLGTLESDEDNWTDVAAPPAKTSPSTPAKTEAGAAKRAEKQ